MEHRKRSHAPFLIVLICIAGIGWAWYNMAGMPEEVTSSASGGVIHQERTMASQTESVESRPPTTDTVNGCFQLMKDSICAQRPSVYLEGAKKETFEQAYARLIADPTMFGVSGCNYTSGGRGVEVVWIWNCDDYTDKLAAAVQAADGVVAGIDPNASDYEKVLYVHDWLCSHVTYSASTDTTDQNIYGALVLQQAVCSGYCNAFAYLLGRLGVEAAVVKGTAENESHAWNSVVLDGETYYCDVTWDDQESEKGSFICYSWFCITSEEMRRQHTPAADAVMPDSTASAYNYYVYNNWQLNSWDENTLIQILAAQSGRPTITVRCADDTIYQQMSDTLFGLNDIGSVLRAAGISASNLQYSEDEEMRTLTFLIS